MSQLPNGYMFGLPQAADNWFTRGMSNPLTHLGMGLLAASQPRMSYTPEGAMPNYGAGLLSGMQSYQQHQQGLLAQQFRQAQLQAQQERLAMERERMEREAATAASEAEARRIVAEMYAGGDATPGELASAHMLASGSVPAGLLNRIYPEEEGPPELRRKLIEAGYVPGSPEYQAAARQILMKPTTQVSITEGAKLASASDLEKFEYLDGTPLGYGMTQSDLAAAVASKRVRRIPPEEAARRALVAREAGQREVLAGDVGAAERALADARLAFERNPTVANNRAVNNAIERLSRARAGQANPRGEPSGDVRKGISDEPGVVGRVVEGVVDAAAGLLGRGQGEIVVVRGKRYLKIVDENGEKFISLEGAQ